MNRKLIYLVCLFLNLNSPLLVVYAQEENESNPILDFLSGRLIVTEDSLKKAVSNLYLEFINDTETLNKVLDTYIIDDLDVSFLKDLNIRFKAFNVKEDSNVSALGLSYSYSRDIQKHLFNKKSASNTGISFAFSAAGNLAFDKNVNPYNFLDTKLSFHLFHSEGGAVEVSDEIAERLNNLELELVEIPDQDSLDNSPAWKEFLAIVSENLTTQYYVDFSLKAALESNQDFSRKQYVYGARLGFDLKAWNPSSTLANLNVFDWPFAVIRVLTGLDKNLSPRGSTIPAILLGLDQVVPSDGSIRTTIDNGSSFPRFRAEVSFKTPVSESAFFVSTFRYYKEIDASSAIISADMDEFIFFSSALTLSNGFYVSYSTGRLPMDSKNEQVYALGFQYNFN